MVQNGRQTGRHGRSRRAVLVAAVGGAVLAGAAGCNWLTRDKSGSTAAPSPLAPALTGTLALIDTYTATIAAQPTLAALLNPLLNDHRSCADALRAAMGSPAPTQASGSGSPDPDSTVPEGATAALAAVHAAEQAAHDAAAKDCLAAAPQYASLLGSIAASRACHLEVLA